MVNACRLTRRCANKRCTRAGSTQYISSTLQTLLEIKEERAIIILKLWSSAPTVLRGWQIQRRRHQEVLRVRLPPSARKHREVRQDRRGVQQNG